MLIASDAVRDGGVQGNCVSSRSLRSAVGNVRQAKRQSRQTGFLGRGYHSTKSNTRLGSRTTLAASLSCSLQACFGPYLTATACGTFLKLIAIRL